MSTHNISFLAEIRKYYADTPAVLLTTSHNIHFLAKIRKKICGYPHLSGAMFLQKKKKKKISPKYSEV